MCNNPNSTLPYRFTAENYPSLVSESTQQQQQRIAQLERDNKHLHTLIDKLQTQNSHKQQKTDTILQSEETIKRIVKEEVAKKTEELSKRLTSLEKTSVKQTKDVATLKSETEKINEGLSKVNQTLTALGDKIKALVDTAVKDIKDIKDKMAALQKDTQNSRTKTPKGTPSRKRARISPSRRTPKGTGSFEDGSLTEADLHESVPQGNDMHTPKSSQNTQAE